MHEGEITQMDPKDFTFENMYRIVREGITQAIINPPTLCNEDGVYHSFRIEPKRTSGYHICHCGKVSLDVRRVEIEG
jgi:hypothetical protein